MKAVRNKDGRSILLTEDADGRTVPQLVTLNVREATSAPEGTRLKLSLLAVEGDQIAPLPFSTPTIAVKDGMPGPVTEPAYTPEFRLEMN